MAEHCGGCAPATTQKILGWFPERVQLHLAMLVLQFGWAGFHIASRTTLNMGISKIAFPVYRNSLGFFFLLPFAYFLEKKERPPINLNLLIHFFLLAIVGITANQCFYMFGLDNTSPTFASAMENLVPAITFLMAAFLRIEKVRLDRKDGISKVAGTLVCIAGASAITLFKGPTIYSPSPSLHKVREMSPTGKSWTLGCLFLIGHCLSWSGWLVLQAPVLKKYPARLSFTSYQLFFGILQLLVLAALVERDLNAWRIHNGSELFSVFYAGVVGSGIAFSIQVWCLDKAGPVFVALYQPVQTLVVALMSSVALGEEFYLGGVIGAILIILGLYLVLWGKNEERKFSLHEKHPHETVSPTVPPLLSQ